MNDKIIINTIEKIHFSIISFLLFIFMVLCVLFIFLQNGVHIENISLPNFEIKKLYIKWDEKINIDVKEINIVKKSDKNISKINYKQINRLFKDIVLFDNWFEKINIKKISFNDISGSFKYVDGKDGFLIISSKNFLLKSSLFYESNFLNMKITEFKDYKRKININGNIIIDNKNLKIISSLDVDINSDVLLKIYSTADREKLFYNVKSLKNIKNIKHSIDLFNLNDNVRYWVYDAIKMSDTSLKTLYGWIDYKHLDKAYKNLYAKAVVNNLEYTYDEKLDSVRTKNTELIFKDGILYIRPNEPHSYNFNLDKSWLKIDFSKKEEILTLYLLFNGKVNKDLLYLLKRYGINLPFSQNRGRVDTNLKLTVNLRTVDVDAKGTFFTKKANFNYLGLDIDIFNAYISLNNYDIIINNMLSKYKDIATALVNVKFDAKKHKGEIAFNVKDIKLNDINLSLKKQKTPLNLIYNISPKQDTLKIEKTIWKFKNKFIHVDSINIPFNLDKLYAQIPATLIEIPNFTSAYVSGEIFLKSKTANLNIDLLKFSLNNINLTQSNTPLKLFYDKNITIKSDEQIRLNIDGFDSILDKTLIKFQKENLNIKYSALKINDIMQTAFKGTYNLENKNGLINLQNFKFKNEQIGQIFSDKKTLNLHINSNENETTIKNKELFINYILKKDGWKLEFNSINKIAGKSKILRDYNITNGSLTIFKKNYEDYIRFSANTIYPYKIMVIDNIPVENYNIEGKVSLKTKKTSLHVNNSVNLSIDDDIKISTKNIGINLNAVSDFFNDKNSTSTSLNKPNVILDSKNCYLYISKDRHIISDKIDLQYFNNIVTAQLIHKNGSAGFKFEKDTFHLYGENFGDEFMENIFALSDFKNGNLTFSIDGTTKEYDGIFHIKDTIVLDYKILNNILAFVNTVPSLVTFSLPGYSSKGLRVKDAYADFHFKNDLYNISNIKVDSKELDIVGKGAASIKKNSIDLELNLKSDLGSTLSKVPIVGYILLGKDSISTTLAVTGALDNPKIKSLVAKDIIVAPLNIIKRTIMFPFNIFSDKDKK